MEIVLRACGRLGGRRSDDRSYSSCGFTIGISNFRPLESLAAARMDSIFTVIGPNQSRLESRTDTTAFYSLPGVLTRLSSTLCRDLSNRSVPP